MTHSLRSLVKWLRVTNNVLLFIHIAIQLKMSKENNVIKKVVSMRIALQVLISEGTMLIMVLYLLWLWI